MSESHEDIPCPVPGADETVISIGPYFLLQRKKGHKLTPDTLLLADFILPLKNEDTVIDIGSGSGVIPLILAHKSSACRMTAVEIDADSAGLLQRNIANNGLSDRIDANNCDYRALPTIYKEGSFSVVVSNPPYVKKGEGRVSPHNSRAVARAELAGSLGELLYVSRYLAGSRGRICYVFPYVRYEEMIEGSASAGLRVRRLCFIHTRKNEGPKIFLIELGETGEAVLIEPIFL